jgi:micrococcal nuclease
MIRHRRESGRRSDPHRRRYTRRRALGYLLAVLIAAVLILCDRMGVFGHRPEPASRGYHPDAAAVARNNAADWRAYHARSFKVTRVIDGDTLDVDVRDDVLGKGATRIRLWGVDTPETVKPKTPRQHFGPEASEFTRKLCTGRTVRLELVRTRDTRGKYGRLLAYVSLSPAGAGDQPLCLNAELISRGYGYCDPRFSHPRKAEFRDLQHKARQNGAGLWAGAGDNDLPYYYRGKIKLGQ